MSLVQGMTQKNLAKVLIFLRSRPWLLRMDHNTSDKNLLSGERDGKFAMGSILRFFQITHIAYLQSHIQNIKDSISLVICSMKSYLEPLRTVIKSINCFSPISQLTRIFSNHSWYMMIFWFFTISWNVAKHRIDLSAFSRRTELCVLVRFQYSNSITCDLK